MRTLFVSRDQAMLKRVREELAESSINARLEAGELVDDWAIVGQPEEVVEKIGVYQQRLGMTHLIATRLRIGGIPEPVLRDSVALLAETLVGR